MSGNVFITKPHHRRLVGINQYAAQSNKNNADTGVDCRVLINNINYVLWPTN
ncbi:Uncharacterised protein [Shigella sonnei]|nr:Uncharacterised protein [Shigella sonnei]